MVVTAAALEGESQKRRPHRIDAIGDISHAELFFDDTPFFILHMQSIEGGRQTLSFGGLRQQIPRQLPGQKLIERQVLIEGLNDPVAIRPDGSKAVHLIAMGIGVPGNIQPLDRHPLTIAWRIEQSIDQSFIGLRSVIREERINLGQGRREAGEIKRQPSYQCGPGGRRGWLQSLLFQFL